MAKIEQSEQSQLGLVEDEIISKSEMDNVDASFSDNATRMMKKRYLQKRRDGTQETPAEMILRIASAVAGVEAQYKQSPEKVKSLTREFFYMIANKEFTPAGRTITNAGAPTSVVANCIVLPIEDSMKGIFKTLKDAALLQKAGSGLGFSFGRLRPAGTVVEASVGMASGPISFLQVYNQAFGVIKQQGRNGANMAILPVDHPDILDFIHCKQIEGSIRNFNISVGMTDEFMKAVNENPDQKWLATFDGKKMKPRRITRDGHGITTDIEELDITAGELYQEIVEGAWRNGEPGVVFLDAVNRTNTLPDIKIEACNPCGEQFLQPYDVCNLGSINLAAFVKEGNIDIARLKKVTELSTRFLDDVVDLFDYPVREVQEMSRKTRRIGLGVMGYADLLFQLNVGYDSKEGFKVAEKIMKIVQDEAHDTSVRLADEKGVFPLWKDSIFAKQGIKRRNTMVTTVAPTGSISMFFDTSSGIEPQFALAYTKQDKDGHTYRYVNRYLEKALKDAGIYTDEIMDKVIAEGTLVGIDGVPQDIKEVFRVAMDISPEDHIKAQAAFQKYVENSISKTINFPNEATIEDIKGGYILAWQSGCKGCTLYRDGSREIQVLNLNKNLAKAKSLAPGKENQSINSGLTGSDAVKTADKGIDPIVKLDIKVQPQVGQGIVPRQRPDVMAGVTYKLKTPYGNMYVTINQDANGPFEIFSQLGKAGGFFQAQSEAICRMISLALRTGIDVEEIIDQLKGIRGPDVTFANGVTTYSLPDAIGRALENHINKSQATLGLDFDINSQDTQTLEMPLPSKPVTNTNKSNIADLGHAPVCPDCASMLTLGEGCFKCNFCGYSKC